MHRAGFDVGRPRPINAHLAGVVARLPCFLEALKFKGSYHLKHYSGRFTYRSLVTGENESIKLELSLREEVLLPSVEIPAKTMLIDPLTNVAAITPIIVHALSLREAYAEKTRAALTRRKPAIRDFFDLDNAVRKGLLEHRAPEFLGLVSQKLAIAEEPVDISDERFDELGRQIETQLKPVLRTPDFEKFALGRVVALVLEIAAGCGR